MLKVGDIAPEFVQTTHLGESLSLSNLRGRKVLLWFFPEAGSPRCTTEAKSFQEHRHYFDENNVALLGGSFDTVEDNAAFARKLNLDFSLLWDPSRTLGLAFGACRDEKTRYPE